MDLAPDLLIPDVPASQLALVEEDLDAGRAKCLANLLSSLPVLRGVAEKHRVYWFSHEGTKADLKRCKIIPIRGLRVAPVGGSLA